MSISRATESIEHDAFIRVMNPPEDGFDGQADIRTDGSGKNENVLLDERIQMAILKAIKRGNHIEIHPSKVGVKIYEVKKRIIE